MILHITHKDDWLAAVEVGKYSGDTLATEGFIHCSTSGQVIDVANYMFKGVNDLVLLAIDEEKVKADIRYEDAGNGELYPHIYGEINIDAVVNTVLFLPQEDGFFLLPKLA